MTFRYETDLNDNVVVLSDEGTRFASKPGSSALVALRDVTLPQLRKCWQSFEKELRATLADVYGKTPSEFLAWHVYNESFALNDDIVSADSCVGFKRMAAGGPKLHYLKQPPVIEALIDLQLVPIDGTRGQRRRSMPRGAGGVPPFCQALPIEDQRRIIRHVFADRNLSLDDIVFISQTSVIDTEQVEKLLADAVRPEAVLQGLAEALSSFDLEQQTATAGGKGAGRHFAAPWFCTYLAREGYVLLPRLSSPENILPRVLAPFLWTLFVPEEARPLASHLVSAPGREQWDYAHRVLRELVLYTNFMRCGASAFMLDHLLALKQEYTASDTGRGAPRASAAQLGHGINRIFEAYIAFHGRKWEGVGPEARFFGGGRRIAIDNGRDAFSWVEKPQNHKLDLYRSLIGEPPDQFPEFIKHWALELRNLLPDFKVKAVDQKIDALNHWLIFLMKLGDEAPRTWQEINREKHLNHLGQGTHLTYTTFIEQLDRGNKQRLISTLAQAWALAATKDGFASKVACPIDVKRDSAGLEDDERPSGRTRRKAIPEPIYHILVEENRRNDFAFAQSLAADGGPRSGRKLHNRQVRHADTDEKVDVFWPAQPILMDMILCLGVRQNSALWMDSGEGDESWVEPGSLALHPNALPSRTTGRAEGFLRISQIGPKEGDKVLGMYIGVNKTGPYGVPWVDPEVAHNYMVMRDWQIRWNPISQTVAASRNDLEIQYAGEGQIPKVFPVFRDPSSRSAHPPTQLSLYAYWTALLKHCEPIVQQKLGDHESLLVNGKPRWDLHSLRVTTISTLLEYGVEPWIVAELAGHASVAMTWHYKEVNSGKTHQALQAAFDKRRQRVIEGFRRLQEEGFEGTDEEFEAKEKEILGGGEFVFMREDNIGSKLFRESISNGGAYEVFAHGICPGADCSTGGGLYKNVHGSVFRQRACSRCRFRLTGPHFLAGLVHRMNSLMVEIKASWDKETNLNLKIEEAEDRGEGASGGVRNLHSIINREREFRDELWSEWCAEAATIRMSEARDREAKGGSVPVITSMSLEEVSLQRVQVHQLALLHSVVTDGSLLAGANIEVPDGLRARRDEMLLEVAGHNDISAFFCKLAPEHRGRALDRFGDLLLDHTTQTEGVQQLISGERLLAFFPALQADVDELLINGGGSAPDLATVPALESIFEVDAS